MMVLVDCDVASTLAKIDRINLLKEAFPDADICITSSVYSELSRAKDDGLSFPDKIFKSIPVIMMEEGDFSVFQEISPKRFIHFGEAEGLSIAKNRGAIFLPNDSQVIRFCKESDISVLGLKDFLVLIAMKRVVSLADMKTILRDIAEKDRTFIKEKDLAAIIDNFIE